MKNHTRWCTFSDETFFEEMEAKVAPFLKQKVQEGTCLGSGGIRIHYYYANQENAKGSMVLCHGFCEFFGKYHELAYYFYEQGYSFYFLEHRGHGYSEREIEEWDKVYVNDYHDYVEDLKSFIDQVVLPVMTKNREKKENLFLYAHSMGGAIGTLFLETYPEYFKCAILSSPLMEMNLGKVPLMAAKVIFFLARKTQHQLNYVPGQRGFDGVRSFSTSSTLSEPRYEYVFRMREQDIHNQTCGGCYSWTEASVRATEELQKKASKIELPILLLQAGRDTMVKSRGQKLFCKKARNVQCVCFVQSKHEIFNATEEIRASYYERIFDFLDNNRQ